MKKIMCFFLISCFSFTIISCGDDKEESSATSTSTVVLPSYVAVGTSGTILTSTDGTTWTERTSGTSMYLEDITY